jgi:ABC-2 type transport system permease protein
MLTIRTGEVVTDLNKPCNFFLYWFSRESGRSFYYFFWRGLPTYLVGWLIFGTEFGAGWLALVGFLGCLILGAMSGIAFRVLLNLVAFWLLEARAVITLGLTMAQFFTGNFFPAAFFPAWLYALASWLPFNGMINAPAQIFLGKLSGGPLLAVLALQMGWLIVLIIVVLLLTAIATRRVVVQGG